MNQRERGFDPNFLANYVKMSCFFAREFDGLISFSTEIDASSCITIGLDCIKFLC